MMGRWILHVGCWTLDVGRWVLGATAIIAVLIGASSSVAAADDATPLAEVTAQRVGGEEVSGRLVALDAERITLEAADGQQQIATDELLRVEMGPASPEPAATESASVWVDLVDGSHIAATRFTMDDNECTIQLPGQLTQPPRQLAEVTAPADAVRAVRFAEPGEAVAGAWRKLLDEQRDGDLLVIRRGDTLDYHRGVVLAIDEEKVQFDLDGDTLPVAREKLHGVALLRTGQPPGSGRCTVIDTHGSRWSAERVKLGDGFEWTTPAGVTVRMGVKQIASLDFSGGKVTLLGQLEPRSVDWRPYLPMNQPLAARRALFQPRLIAPGDGQRLAVDGRAYQHGLWLHSRAEVVFSLPEGMRRLQAEVGIADPGRPHGDAVLRIDGDGRTLLEVRLQGTDPPRPIDVDTSGVRRLTIHVDYGQNMDVGDQVILGEARLIK